jgi:hypothetical protein
MLHIKLKNFIQSSADVRSDNKTVQYISVYNFDDWILFVT